jgi:SPP1 family predicted phage head-tail adaptor
MRARSFQKRIELWQTEEVFDGVSGNTNKDVLITSIWANVSTLNDNKRNNALAEGLGVEDRSNTIVVKLRRRADITYNSVNQFLKYRGFKYIIQSQPTNIDFDNSYVVILATRQSVNEVSELTPDNSSNTVYTNYVNNSIENGSEATSNDCLLTFIEEIT